MSTQTEEANKKEDKKLFDSFLSTFGRSWNDQEAEYMRRGYRDNKAIDWANNLKAKYQGLDTLIDQQASASGLTLTPQEKLELRNLVFKPEQVQTEAQITGSDAQGLVNQKLNSMGLQKAVDTITKEPTISDANRQKAAELLTSTYKEVNPNYTPTQDEIDYFASELASGQMKPYEIASMLRGTQSYQESKVNLQAEKTKAESKSALDQLNQNLQSQQELAFQRALPTIMGTYQRAGRISSSGMQNAIANAQADLERERQSYMGNLQYQNFAEQQGYNRQDFLNLQNQAWSQYLQQANLPYQQRLAQQQANLNLPFQQATMANQYGQSRTARQQEMEDYSTQQSDYLKYFNMQNKAQNKSALYGLGGQVVGTGLNLALMNYLRKP